MINIICEMWPSITMEHLSEQSDYTYGIVVRVESNDIYGSWLITAEHFSSVQSLSYVRLFATPWIAARQASLSITNSQSSLKLMSVVSAMPSNHLILCCPLLLPTSIFPSIRVFSVSQFLTLGGQSIRASASVLSMNIQDWFPLGLIGLISLQSKGLSRVFFNTTVQIINSLVLSFLYGPTITSVSDD